MKWTITLSAGAMQQIVSAVAYCHRQFVLHGDLKPENVLIGGRRPDGSPFCIVCDFGHTTVCIGSALVAAPGDPRYIAPEVIAKENLSSKSDVYMLGVTAFELLTGWHSSSWCSCSCSPYASSSSSCSCIVRLLVRLVVLLLFFFLFFLLFFLLF